MKKASIHNTKGQSSEFIQTQLDNLEYGFEMLNSEEREEVRQTKKELLNRKRVLTA